MKRWLWLLCLCTGCALTSIPDGPAFTPEAATAKVIIGQSTKADVATALGSAIRIPFDSGYEVWVYRWPGEDKTSRTATELVLLFDPAGRLAKLRVRPAYAPETT